MCLDKVGLGYNPEYQQKMHKNFFASTQKASSPLLTCFYYGKKDHSASTCYIRKNCSSIGKNGMSFKRILTQN